MSNDILARMIISNLASNDLSWSWHNKYDERDKENFELVVSLSIKEARKELLDAIEQDVAQIIIDVQNVSTDDVDAECIEYARDILYLVKENISAYRKELR